MKYGAVQKLCHQVGHELMRLIDKSDAHPLSHRDGKLRCVCVDSESKVIGHNYREDSRSSKLYREGNMISGLRGRGNNWALPLRNGFWNS